MSCRSFSKSQRLLRREEYEQTLNFGTKKKIGHFILFIRPNKGKQNRLGMIVTKKVANSVGRNRLKRRIREMFRLDYEALTKESGAHDVVFIARKGASVLTGAQIKEELKTLQ